MEPPSFQEAPRCDVCKCSFNAFRRRHHCRSCGRTLCHEHSANQMALPQFGIYSPVRVCSECFNDSSRQGIAQTENVFIGGDLNGHVGKETGNYGDFHGGHGFGERNEDGEAILDFAMAYALFLANTTFFKKSEEHVITYKSGLSKTQIDFLLMRKGDRITCKDCKVIPGESLANQHRLLVMDVHIKRERKKNKTLKCPRTRWWNLKGEKQVIFREKVITQCVWDRASQMWDSMASCIRKVAKGVLGESKGFAPHQKES
ncbi:uncharacterized protein LOC103950210 isoform X2 [Pyrus x bretschneideri]|uniref:uncharacterized protein LOC103950210 isoform X2 n=1 Tax=Pyrus x bretschneideri TaxID=225117 RepID=UPI00202FE82B|nr:uncharacterized protein LOC103950210 isoform X2 [Pyrus x bretschneideri]